MKEQFTIRGVTTCRYSPLELIIQPSHLFQESHSALNVVAIAPFVEDSEFHVMLYHPHMPGEMIGFTIDVRQGLYGKRANLVGMTVDLLVKIKQPLAKSRTGVVGNGMRSIVVAIMFFTGGTG